jgi:hypothetical protein
MAIIKRIASNSSLKAIIKYVKDIEKTNDKIISGKDCTSINALNKMSCTKKVWNKIGKRQYHHIIQSFLPGEVSKELAHSIGIELAEKEFSGYEVLIATHIDRDHLHNHLIINSVSFVDGRKYIGTRDSLVNLKDKNDGLCREYGLSVIEKPFKKVRDSTAEKKLRQRGIRPWKDDLRYYISEAVKNTNNLLELKKYLKFHYGVDTKIQSSNLSFKHPDKQKFCRGKKLGTLWTREEIEKAFKIKPKVGLKNNKFRLKNRKKSLKIKKKVDYFGKSIGSIERGISWNNKKEKMRREKLIEDEKKKDEDMSGNDMEDDRGLER